MKTLRWLTVFILYINPCRGQGNKQIHWDFKSHFGNGHECILTLTAHISSGWHVYSQFMEKGGPPPTRISFEKSNSYVLTGKSEERGTSVTFHDDTYDAEIIWYEGEVSFVQKILMNKPVTTIKGKLEYMICSDYVCTPREQDFSIDIIPNMKSP